MKAKLQIRNFGPIKDIDIEVSKYNILIGPQAAGKSTISKVLCVIHACLTDFVHGRNFSKSDEIAIPYSQLKRISARYRLENFFQLDSQWYFEDDFFWFKLGETDFSIETGGNTTFAIIVRQKADKLNASAGYYIPAERIALPMISESLFELTLEQSTLPGYFLEFGKDFTLARKSRTLFNLPILGVVFEHKEEKNVVTTEGNISLLLEETSSAVQANLPLLIILQFPLKTASLFVIEELELHGFPILQKKLLNYVIEGTRQSSLKDAYVMLPTHSPYILSAANNLLFAAKVAKQDKQIAVEVDKIISKDSWIEKEDFSAYYIKDGAAKSIVNEKTGLIDENELDGISEDLAGEFDALMELYNPAIA